MLCVLKKNHSITEDRSLCLETLFVYIMLSENRKIWKSNLTFVLFHSNLEGVADSLELGTEVEYSLGRVNGSGGGCASAEFVRALPRGTISIAKSLEPSLNGTVTRTLRALNPDQAQYSGALSILISRHFLLFLFM